VGHRQSSLKSWDYGMSDCVSLTRSLPLPVLTLRSRAAPSQPIRVSPQSLPLPGSDIEISTEKQNEAAETGVAYGLAAVRKRLGFPA